MAKISGIILGVMGQKHNAEFLEPNSLMPNRQMYFLTDFSEKIYLLSYYLYSYAQKTAWL